MPLCHQLSASKLAEYHSGTLRAHLAGGYESPKMGLSLDDQIRPSGEKL